MDRYALHRQFIPAHGKLMPVKLGGRCIDLLTGTWEINAGQRSNCTKSKIPLFIIPKLILQSENIFSIYKPSKCVYKKTHRAAPLYRYAHNVESYNVSILSQACFP